MRSFRTMQLAAIAAAGLMLSVAAAAQADVLASWDFGGLAKGAVAPSPFAPASSDPGVTIGGITRVNVGNGDVNSFGAGQFTFGGDGGLPAIRIQNNAVVPGSLDINLTKYVSFSVAANSGPVTLTSVQFTTGVQDNYYTKQTNDDPPVNIGTFDAQYELRWSVDNFAAALIDGAALNQGNNTVLDVPLSVTTTDPVEFRLYVYAASNGYETAEIGHNNAGPGLVINGSTGAVPEPASLGLLALGGLALLRRRR